MGISVWTVRNYLSDCFTKLEASTLVECYWNLGWLTVPRLSDSARLRPSLTARTREL